MIGSLREAPSGSLAPAAVRAARANRTADLADLARWLAIPSVSVDPRAGPQLVAAADHLDRALTRAGARVHRIGGGPAPVVVGEVTGPPGAPVVLVYGHYDVQAAGSGWTVPPFAVVRRGRALIARGANDDKGQLATVVAALRAGRDGGGLGCRVVVVAEGAEEIGSPGLDRALARLRHRVRPDVVLVCDTERAPDGVPAVTLSQRGRIDAEVLVETPGRPAHPGRRGGAVTDPSLVLADVLRGLRSAVARVPAPPEATWRSRAVLSVTRLSAGRPGAGAIPVRARARIDVRLPPQLPAPVAADLLPGALRRHGRRYRYRRGSPRITVKVMNCHPGMVFAPRAEVLAGLDRACRSVFSSPLRYSHSGGSLPAAVLLSENFPTASAPVLLGLGTANAGAHGPDEWLDLDSWSAGVELILQFLGNIGSILSPGKDGGVRIRGSWISV